MSDQRNKGKDISASKSNFKPIKNVEVNTLGFHRDLTCLKSHATKVPYRTQPKSKLSLNFWR